MACSGCAGAPTRLDPLQQTDTSSPQVLEKESPEKADEVDPTLIEHPGLLAQKLQLDPYAVSAEAPSNSPISLQEEKSPTAVTIPAPLVLSKILPDDIAKAPAPLNLNTPTLRWQSSTSTPQVGNQFIVSIETQQVMDLFSAPFYLRYDPQILEFIGLTEGEFLKSDGGPTIFIYNVEPEAGQVIVGLRRLGEEAGVSGSGTLALATFKAKRPGTARVVFQEVDFRDVRLEPIRVTPEVGQIQIR